MPRLLLHAYDNLGRMRQAATANHAVQRVYDALDRVEIENSYLGSKSMEYDLAGRMTKLTRRDLNHFDYEYLVTGELKVIRENSGPWNGHRPFGYDPQGFKALRCKLLSNYLETRQWVKGHRLSPRAAVAYSASTIVTFAMPPPSHMVWRP